MNTKNNLIFKVTESGELELIKEIGGPLLLENHSLQLDFQNLMSETLPEINDDREIVEPLSREHHGHQPDLQNSILDSRSELQDDPLRVNSISDSGNKEINDGLSSVTQDTDKDVSLLFKDVLFCPSDKKEKNQDENKKRVLNYH